MSLITKITTAQRLDMIQKGLSPLSEDHVKQYLDANGKIQESYERKIERASTLIGNEGLKNTLGGGTDTGFDYTKFSENGNSPSFENNDLDEIGNLERKMNKYVGSGLSNPISAESLLSLKKQPTNKKSETTSLKDPQKTGFEMSIKYLNAFVIHLQNTDSQSKTKSRYELYKHLKKVLEVEKSLQNNKEVLFSFKKGCYEAELKMYENLKNS